MTTTNTELVERLARELDPKAWAALAKENDSTKHRDRRVASLKRAALNAGVEEG